MAVAPMVESADPDDRRPAKSAGAFRTISEVAQELEVPQHVLRFWESRFSQVRPLKRAGGRRYYRPEDVELLRRIRQCLYQEGYTIKGVQRLLRAGTLREAPHAVAPEASSELELAPGQADEAAPEAASPEDAEPDPHSVVAEVIAELSALRDMLRRRGR